MRKVIYLTLFVMVLSMGSCTLPQMVKLAKEQQLTVSPNPLEVHKDTVTFDLSANLPVKMLKKGTVYTVNTFYKHSGDKELALNPIPFKAEDFPNAATEQPKITKTFAFPYQDSYKSGTIEVEGVATKGTKSKVTPRLVVAKGVITTSKLVKPSYYAAFAEHGYNNQEEIIPVIIPDFIFERGKSVLRKSEIKGATGTSLDAFIASKNATRTVTITGTHSPEGLERINTKLSPERAAAIETFYRAEMKKYDYQGKADSIQFILKPVIQDWTEFKTALNSYEGISAEDKAEYINIIGNGGTFADQETQMKKLKTYKKVFADVYPKLRTAKTEILTVKDKKTDAEISVLARQITQGSASAESLTFEELMYAGTLTPSNEEKAAIYEAATKKGSNWNAHNNLGAAYLALAMENPSRAAEYAEKALAQLQIAARLKETGEVHLNLASAYAFQKNAYSAYNHANLALKSGLNNDNTAGANGIKAYAEIVKADYANAVRSASSATPTAINLFNKGLAQLLNKDFQNAAASFAEAGNKDGKLAIAYYGAAIAGARQGNAEAVVSNLIKAVGIDPSLKEAALADLEFEKFAASEAFRNALK